MDYSSLIVPSGILQLVISAQALYCVRAEHAIILAQLKVIGDAQEANGISHMLVRRNVLECA